MDKYDFAGSLTGKLRKPTAAAQIATRDNDPQLAALLKWLPNPDPILRKMGRQQEAYEAISYDPHVAGELRTMRGAVGRYEYRVMPSGSGRADRRAYELCKELLDGHGPDPAKPARTWQSVIWEMYRSRLYGYAAHEVVFDQPATQVGYWLPRVIEVPQRRVLFDPTGRPRLRTQAKPSDGVPMDEPRHWLITTHMEDSDNPYGFALFSAIFWANSFKHSGMGWYANFMRRYGIPKGVAKVPPGTPQGQRDDIARQMESMVEYAVAVITNDSSAELLAAPTATQDMHQGFIDLCNREISKALRSQTLATEIQGNGSRAASETHRGREEAGDESDREDIAASFNLLFRWVTEINVPGAIPPYFDFFEESEARQEWAELFETARGYLDVPREFAHEVLQIPKAKDGEETLPAPAAPPAPAPDGAPPQFSRQACPHCGGHHDYRRGGDSELLEEALADQLAERADRAVDDWLATVMEMGESAQSLAEFRAMIDAGFGKLDRARMAQAMERGFLAADLRGRADVRDESERG